MYMSIIMFLYMYNFESSRMSRERGRRVLNDVQYRVHTLPEHVMVSIPGDVIDSLFQEGSSLTITLRPSPESFPSPSYRSGPGPRPPWSDDEELYF